MRLQLLCTDVADLARTGSDGVPRQLDGGAPLLMDGKITLCGRSDRQTMRGYTGLLAKLALFDSALTEAQAAYIFNAVRMRVRGCKPAVIIGQRVPPLRLDPAGVTR